MLANKAELVAIVRAFRSGDVEHGVPASVGIEMVKQEIKPNDFLMPAMDKCYQPISI